MLKILLLLVAPVIPVELCSVAPEPPAIEPPEWHWRMVDKKKCYFRADRLLPREDLVWSYGTDQFDEEEGANVKGRRHYNPEELRRQDEEHSQAAEERREQRRERRNRRRNRDDDDD